MFITTGGGDQQLKQVEREREGERGRERERKRKRKRDLWDVPPEVVMSSSNRLCFAATMHTRMLTYADAC